MRLLLALVLLLVAVPSAEACYGVKGRETVVRNDEVRVYRVSVNAGQDQAYSACDRRSGRSMRLGESDDQTSFEGFLLAGRYLAYQEGGGKYGDGHLGVHLVDVRARKMLLDRSYGAYTMKTDLTVHGQALTFTGAYAYLAGAFHPRGAGDVDTYEVVAGGKVVDSGTDIDPASFSAADGVARWRRAGEERSYRFEPASIRVPQPVAEWYTCSGVPRLRASALDNPPGYERRKGRLARALRRVPYRGIGQPRRGWQFLVRSGSYAAVVNRRGSSYGLMTFERDRRGRWIWSQSGGCGPRAWRDDLEANSWEVKEPPAADARRVSVLVEESHCASGRDATGRILPPWVHYGEETITVTFHVRPLGGFQTCQGGPPTPFVLELDEPVGGRRIVDGGPPPPRASAAAARRHCYGKVKVKQRRTIVSTGEVRVYKSVPGGLPGDGVYVACDRRNGKVMRLGEDGISDGPVGFRAAGRFVAYRYWQYWRGGGDDHVDVKLVDVHARRVVLDRSYSAYNFEPRADLRHFHDHLSASGAYAFLIGTVNAQWTTYYPDARFEVFAGGRAVDLGPDIDPGSFRVEDGVVRWRRGGEERSAPLAP